METNNQEMRELVNRLREYKDILYPEAHESAEAIESLTRRVSELEGELRIAAEFAKAGKSDRDALRAELESIKGQVPVYVPIATRSSDEIRGRHPNDDTPIDAECQAALDRRGDDRGQGLCTYWKWGFRSGWFARGNAKPVAPAQAQESAQKVPETASDIRSFIGSNFNAIEYGQPDEKPSDDDVYVLSAHDLLSAFCDWQDFTAAPTKENNHG